jgi:hypothetical protein
MRIVLEDLAPDVIQIVRNKARRNKISLELALNRLIKQGYANLKGEQRAKPR